MDRAERLGAKRGTTLVAIGSFDGVHRGHQALVDGALAEARARGLIPVVLTFEPHPALVVGRVPPPLLTTLERKLGLLGRAPELVVVVEPFTKELSEQSPEAFAEKTLADALGAAEVLVGANFRFGKGRSGDLAALRELGERLGFGAASRPLVTCHVETRTAGQADGVVSSSRIRALVASGEVEAAETLLTRPHALTGRVVRGDGRGRGLGFPTANLSELPEAEPAEGVYACLVERLGPTGAEPQTATGALAAGVVNIGVRPTVAAGKSVEVHVLDVDTPLYGEVLRCHLVARLRAEERFGSLDALRRQIGRDIERARAFLGARGVSVASGAAWR